ncbi:MAG: hypothetical protein AAFN07_11995 [Pseudomonadota bacterium]
MKTLNRTVLMSFAVAAIAFSTDVIAHGDRDEEKLAEFQLHLDSYEQDIVAMVATVGSITSNTEATREDVDALIQQWEDVTVHEAIEDKATLAYPGVWQALILFQQAVDAGDGVAEAGENVKSALWQGMGALRMAATIVDATSSTAVEDGGALSGPESISAIISDLNAAVASYVEGDSEGAQRAIFDTYENRFEYLEGDLIPKDPDLVTALEADFNATLPLLLKRGADEIEVRRTVANMTTQLEAARSILEAVESQRGDVF